MFHQVSDANHTVGPWQLADRLRRLAEGVGAVVRRVARLGMMYERGAPHLWMSREWLKEHERRSGSHPE